MCESRLMWIYWTHKIQIVFYTVNQGGWEGARIIVLYTCVAKERQKMGCFFEADSCKLQLGVKMSFFWILLRAWGQNHAKFSFIGGVFPGGEIVIRIFKKKSWSYMCTTLVFKGTNCLKKDM